MRKLGGEAKKLRGNGNVHEALLRRVQGGLSKKGNDVKVKGEGRKNRKSKGEY